MARRSVAIDTTFLITLANSARQNHNAAKSYYKYFLENDFEMLLSTIVIAEFCAKQSIGDLPIRNFTVLPFNYDDAVRCAELFGRYNDTLKSNLEAQRDALKDDYKIIAQAVVRTADFLITEDTGTMCKMCDSFRKSNETRLATIVLSESMDLSYFQGGQISLPLQESD